MFINFSNHSSDLWGEHQLAAAHVYGEIKDIPFPNIDPSSDEQNILELAESFAQRIYSMNPDAVLCQGEMSFCYAVVSVLKKKGIRVLCSTSERKVITSVNENGETVKTATFCFVRFREYLGS